MSYGIIRIEKYKKGSVKGIQIHDQRQKDISHTNKDIDFNKSDMNYDLHNSVPINFTEKVNERIKDLNLKKAVRHDAVVMCQCLITSDRDFFDNMSKEQQDKFFKDSYSFVCHRYGKQNIISATVHFDERTPHMHINFVPVTADGRLCAKDLFKKKDLSLLHDDFYKFNKSRGYALERGESKDEFQKHLSTEEFKLKKQEEYLKQDQEELKKQELELKKNENVIKKAVEASRNALNILGHRNIIQTKKTLLRGNITLSESDFKRLQALADVGVMYNDLDCDYKKLSLAYEELEKENRGLKKKAEIGVSERMKYAKEISDLKNKCNTLIKQNNNLVYDRLEILEFVKDNQLTNNLNQFQNDKRNQEQIQRKSFDFGMER